MHFLSTFFPFSFSSSFYDALARLYFRGGFRFLLFLLENYELIVLHVTCYFYTAFSSTLYYL